MLVVGYIGFGVSVREYHLPFIEGKENIKVKYIFRRQEDINDFIDYEKLYPDYVFTSNLEDILNDEEINLVVVCAPDKFHVPYSLQCLKAGKNVLCEKPFASTSQEAKEVFDFALKSNLTIMPNQNRRFDADYLAVKEVMASGKLGKIVRLESHYDYFKTAGWNQLPALYNLGVHTTDQIIGLFGLPLETKFDVRSIHHPHVADDYFDIEFYYDNMKASIHTSMCVAIDYPSFIVNGTNGSLILPPVLHGSGKKKSIERKIISKTDAPKERWGKLVYYDIEGNKIVEDVKVGYNHYDEIYENLDNVINNKEEKIIKDEEVIKVLEILQEATKNKK